MSQKPKTQAKKKTLTNHEALVRAYNWLRASGTYLNSQAEMIVPVKDGEIVKKLHLDSIATLAITNAILPSNAHLLYGGHGGGKTSLVVQLGRLMTGEKEDTLANATLRCNAQTSQSDLATLELGPLMNGEGEKVKLRDISTSIWKTFDEINRMNPYAQALMLPLIGEGIVQFRGHTFNCDSFTSFATINPGDMKEGVSPVVSPLLDRFGTSNPVPQAGAEDLVAIFDRANEKLHGYGAKPLLTKKKLEQIRNEVDSIPVTADATKFIIYLSRDLTLCERSPRNDKGLNQHLRPSSNLCQKCNFEPKTNKSTICGLIDNNLSVRAALAYQRSTKAMAYFVEEDEATLDIALELGKNVVYHRSKPNKSILSTNPYYGNDWKMAQDIIDREKAMFNLRKNQVEPKYVKLVTCSQGSDNDVADIRKWSDRDLMVKYDMLPIAEDAVTDNYKKSYRKIQKARKAEVVGMLVGKDMWEFNLKTQGLLIGYGIGRLNNLGMDNLQIRDALLTA